jgi:RHS repeat-associated protein
VILRDRDANTGWTSSGDGTLEERRFYAQNWRADVVAITKSDGQPTEFIRYTSYGTAQAFAAADVNRDGVVNSTDSADWADLYSEASSGAAIPVDFDYDGSSFNPDDNDAFNAAYSAASGWSNGGAGVGGGRLSRIGNRKGYAGYEFDHSVEAYHVRHRVYVPEIGRWNNRDPLGYQDGSSQLQYIQSRVILGRDPMGLASHAPAPSSEECISHSVRVGVSYSENS